MTFSIKRKLTLALSCISIVPLIFFAAVSFHYEKQSLFQRVGERHQLAAEQTMKQVEKLLYFASEAVRVWSKNNEVLSVSNYDLLDSVERMLQIQADTYPFFFNIYIVDEDGIIQSANDADLLDESVGEQEWYQEARVSESTDVLVGELFFDTISYDYVIPLSIKIKGNNRKMRLGALLNWTALRNIIHDIDKNPNTQKYTVLINRLGLVVTGPDFLIFSENSAESLSKINLIREGWKGAKLAQEGKKGFHLESRNDGDWLVAYPGESSASKYALSWGIVTIVSNKLVFQDLNVYLELLAFCILFIAVIAIFIALGLSQMFVRPIQNLLQLVNRISKGEAGTLINNDRNDEIGDLSDAFNRMSCNLKSNIDELVKARDRALNSERAKENFLANMSHEIRTPMNSIIGFSQLLLQESLQESSMEFARNISNSSKSLLRLINDILDHSKLEENSFTIERREFSLETLMEEQLCAFSILANKDQIELILTVDQKVPPTLYGDSGRISQVLTNLIGNALKFTSKGEVELSVDLPIGESNSTNLDSQGEVVFTIRDTGSGISSEYLPSLFDRFTQESESTTRNYGGSGLGLSIVKQLVSLMRGEVSVESSVGKGSRFCFSLPLRENIHPSTVCNNRLGGILRCAIVNSNEAATNSIRSYLSSWNISSDNFCRYDDFYTNIATNKFDLILVDENSITNRVYFEDSLGNVFSAQAPHCTIGYIRTNGRPLGYAQKIKKIVTLDKPLMPSRLCKIVESLTLTTTPVENVSTNVKNKSEQLDMSMVGSRILIVDDTQENRLLAVKVLDKMGILTEEAKSGYDAIKMSVGQKFDLILMDIQMPGMDGYEATSLIRQRLSDIPIIAMTANAMPGCRDACFDAGMNDYISKPVDLHELRSLLLRWLGTSSLVKMEIKEESANNASKELSTTNNQQMQAVFNPELGTILEEFRLLLKNSDPTSKSKLVSVEAELEIYPDIRKELAALKSDLANYRFGEAGSHLQEIAINLNINLGS